MWSGFFYWLKLKTSGTPKMEQRKRFLIYLFSLWAVSFGFCAFLRVLLCSGFPELRAKTAETTEGNTKWYFFTEQTQRKQALGLPLCGFTLCRLWFRLFEDLLVNNYFTSVFAEAKDIYPFLQMTYIVTKIIFSNI
jgi:hypothetical protein